MASLRQRTKTARRELVQTTAGNTFTSYVTKTGRIQYRKNGRFTSARAFNSAKSQTLKVAPARVESVATLRVRTGSGQRDPGERGALYGTVARNDGLGKIDYFAGPQIGRYYPGIQPGEKLTSEQTKFLIDTRRAERNFFAFASSEQNLDKPRDQLLAEYQAFLTKMEEVDKLRAQGFLTLEDWQFEREQLLAEYWGGYGENK